MGKNLVIVESPAKVKTIKKFLGSNYEVCASNRHIRDLPKSQMGIDIENDFEPKYITIRGKGDILANLKKQVKKADKVYLATDPDREGEAISWHLSQALKLDDKHINRISFNEITKNAVKASIKEPRKIDMNLVNAQQSRRILDRMVGYKISPLLWAKVKRGLSAGRVQSVALRIICDREDEINSFIPEEYWTLDAVLNVKGEKKPVVAHFYGNADGRMDIKSAAEMDAVVAKLEKEQFAVESVKKGEKSKKAPLPFTTSTLQQEASKMLNFSTQKTMRLAQQLYEGVDIAGQGTIGIITYLRTDSTRVAEEAQVMAHDYIESKYGDKYLMQSDKKNGSKKKIQDAHEAIRPTDISLTPADVKESLSRDQFRLYQLIWKRFVASQMAPAVYETTSVRIAAGKYRFSVAASKVVFDGFMSVYKNDDDNEETNTLAKGLDENSVLSLSDINGTQHFTQPPAHFTEASLVKTLEELGIGRPSTYAPTISTIINRHYVAKEQKNLYITELGEVVNKLLTENFGDIVDVEFTAKVETEFDEVASGKEEWKQILRDFYPPFENELEKVDKELEHVKLEDEVSDVQCDKCGRMMVVKMGRFGKFLACPGYPECKNVKPFVVTIDEPCPVCGGKVQVRKTKRKRNYYICENNPKSCNYISWNKPKKGEVWTPEEVKEEGSTTTKRARKTTKTATKRTTVKKIATKKKTAKTTTKETNKKSTGKKKE